MATPMPVRIGIGVAVSLAAVGLLFAVGVISGRPAAPVVVEEFSHASPVPRTVDGVEMNYTGTMALAGLKEQKAEIGIVSGRSYAPSVITATAGQQIIVDIKNEDFRRHTFTIDSLVDKPVLAHRQLEVLVIVPPDGEPLTFYCTFHGNLGMRGIIKAAS